MTPTERRRDREAALNPVPPIAVSRLRGRADARAAALAAEGAYSSDQTWNRPDPYDRPTPGRDTFRAVSIILAVLIAGLIVVEAAAQVVILVNRQNGGG